MCINFKVLGIFVTAFLVGCSGNSDNSKVDVSSDIKRFSGVVNNSSVLGINVGAIQIGKHGQFALNDEGEVSALTNTSDKNGKFGFSISEDNIGPYILSVIAPEYEAGQEDELAAKASCQVALGCSVNGKEVLFGEYYAIEPNRQWSAAIEFVENGQFIVVNPITEMAKAYGYTEYINNRTDTSTTEGTSSAPNYYSNYNIVKGNSQTASLLGLSDVLSIEPANLALLYTLNVDTSNNIEESIRYGALIAAWQQLELEYNNSLLSGDLTFQQAVIKEYLANKGQLYQSFDSDPDKFTLKKWYQTALDNLIEVQKYHRSLNRALPSEIDRVKARFVNEISIQKNGESTTAKPSIPDYYIEDYSDAVMKTKAMVNYITNLQDNFANQEYREGIEKFSDLVIAETRRLSPQLDIIFEKLLSVQEYYLSCVHGTCDDQSIWHGNTNIYTESTKTLIINNPSGTNLKLSQSLVFDDINPEGSTETNVHDLFLSGFFEFDNLKVELSDSISEESDNLKSSFRYSFASPLSQIPLPPEEIIGGMGLTENEDLVPDYIEIALPNFKLYDPLTLESDDELTVLGSLTALMISNTDAADLLRTEQEKLGKRFNLSSVIGTFQLLGQSQYVDDLSENISDGTLFYFDATSSESFVSSEDTTAYFPDTKYPTFASFFKPRDGMEKGTVSPFPLVVSRKGVMNFPKLDSEGNPSETEVVEVQYIELDYEMGGLERYVVYPKIEGDEEYWGIICTANSTDEDTLDSVAPGYTVDIQDSEGEYYQKSLLSCPLRDKYSGDATPDDFINQVYVLNENLFLQREYNGHGAYRINYPTTADGKLSEFPETDISYTGTLETPIVLGVDSLRFQAKPRLVGDSGQSYLSESLVDISLVWRTRDVIDVDAFLAFDTEQVINNPNESGLPYLAVGSDSESYSIAYRTNADGTESGEYVMAWTGVQFVDGAPGTQVMQKTDVEDLKESVFAGIGSNVSYIPESDVTDDKCGFFERGMEPTAGEECDAIAYFTFRGLVTGSLREERDGVYVIRYIDGSWQILGQ